MSRALLVRVVVLLVVLASLGDRWSWPGLTWGAEAEAQLSPDLAPLGVEVEGGLPPRPPDPLEGGKEGVGLCPGVVEAVVVVHVGVGGGHGGEAVTTGPAILAGVALKLGPAGETSTSG